MKLQTNKNFNNFSFRRLIFIICFVCIVLSPVAAFAKTLRQYRETVRYARDLTITMLYPDVEDATAKTSRISDAEFLTKIRKSIPASEKIEWHGAAIETSNGWLSKNLDAFEREPQTSPKRRLILTAVSERLDALDQNRAKDEDKQKLAEILRRAEFQKPEKEAESIFQKIYRKIMEWLASFFPRPDLSGASASGLGSLSFVLQILLYVLILGVIAFLIYKFAPFFAERFRQKIKKEKTERIILGERISADETADNLFVKAEDLAREGNLRGAIRQGYIALLCELADRKIIGLSRHKTNRDYLRDVRGKNELYQNMNGLTFNFERYWYGFEQAEESDWEEFRNGYKQIIKN
jgi:uncharacterized protein YlbG (UPF0298 family)